MEKDYLKNSASSDLRPGHVRQNLSDQFDKEASPQQTASAATLLNHNRLLASIGLDDPASSNYFMASDVQKNEQKIYQVDYEQKVATSPYFTRSQMDAGSQEHNLNVPKGQHSKQLSDQMAHRSTLHMVEYPDRIPSMLGQEFIPEYNSNELASANFLAQQELRPESQANHDMSIVSHNVLTTQGPEQNRDITTAAVLDTTSGPPPLQGFNRSYQQPPEEYYQEARGKELLNLAIDIGLPQKQEIIVYENDNPEEIAREFCERHGLAQHLVSFLAEQVQSKIEEVQEEIEQMAEAWQQEEAMGEDEGYVEDEGQRHRPDHSPAEGRKLLQDHQENLFSFRSQGEYPNRTENASFTPDRRINQPVMQPNRGPQRNKYFEQPAKASYQNYAQIGGEFDTMHQIHGAPRNVHQRLHQQALYKQKAQKKKQELEKAQEQKERMGHTAPVNFYPRTTVNRGDTDVPPGYTAGDRLYKQGIKAREQKLKQIQEQKKEQEKKEKKDLTFKPSISKLSKSIILRSGENKNPEVHLLKRGQAMKERLEKKRVELEQEERSKLTFKPQINEISDRINEERSKIMREQQGVLSQNLLHYEQQETGIGGSISAIRGEGEETGGLSYLERSGLFQEPFSKNPDRFKALFDDAKRRKERKDKLTNLCLEGECTFQPDIGINKFKYEDFGARGTFKINQSIMNKNSRAGPTLKHAQTHLNTSGGNFYERMVKRQEELESKRKYHKRLSPDRSLLLNERTSKTMRFDRTDMLIDPESGQELFKPKILKNSGNRPSQGKNIGNYLYSQFSEYERIKESKQIEAQQKRELMAKGALRPVSETTVRIFEERKRERFSQLFKQLDDDKDGLISATHISLEDVESDVLILLKPLFAELDELAQTIDEEEFIEALGRLYETLPLPDKKVIVRTQGQGRAKERNLISITNTEREAMSFRPKINKNSVKLASKTRPLGSNIVDVLIKQKQVRREQEQDQEQKREELKKIKDENELNGCTFHPRIKRNPNTYTPAASMVPGGIPTEYEAAVRQAFAEMNASEFPSQMSQEQKSENLAPQQP